MLCLDKLIFLPLHPNILPNVRSSFHKHSSLFLGLAKYPYWDSSRPWLTPKRKQNGVKVHNVSKYPRWYWFSHLFFFPEKLHRCFLIPQESCCWFISILLPLYPSCCLLWCHCRAHASKLSRCTILGFATYPASCVVVYHQDSLQSWLGTGEQRKNLSQLIKLFCSMMYFAIEPPYLLLSLIVKDYSHGSTMSAYLPFTQQYNFL